MTKDKRETKSSLQPEQTKLGRQIAVRVEQDTDKLLSEASDAGLSEADLIRRCLKHLPRVIEEAVSEISRIVKRS